jgi:hypothetical protein
MKQKIKQAKQIGNLKELNEFLQNEGLSVISVSPIMYPESQFCPPSVSYFVLYWKSIEP